MTVGRAALWAAITTLLAILAQTVEVAGLPQLTTRSALYWILQISLGFFVPSLTWLAFFWTIYRECAGATSPLSSRATAWLALTLGVILPLLYVTIPQAIHYVSLTRYGEAMLLLGLTTPVVWTIFLGLYAVNRSDPRIPKIAQGLVILTGLEFANALYQAAFGTHFETWWNFHLVRTGWHLVSTAIWISYAAGRFLFVSAVWRSQDPPVAQRQAAR